MLGYNYSYADFQVFAVKSVVELGFIFALPNPFRFPGLTLCML